MGGRIGTSSADAVLGQFIYRCALFIPRGDDIVLAAAWPVRAMRPGRRLGLDMRCCGRVAGRPQFGFVCRNQYGEVRA